MDAIIYKPEMISLPNESEYYRPAKFDTMALEDCGDLIHSLPVKVVHAYKIRQWRENSIGRVVNVCFADDLANQIIDIQNLTIQRLRERIKELGG